MGCPLLGLISRKQSAETSLFRYQTAHEERELPFRRQLTQIRSGTAVPASPQADLLLHMLAHGFRFQSASSFRNQDENREGRLRERIRKHYPLGSHADTYTAARFQ